MPGFITTDDGDWKFSFDDTPSIPELPVHDPLIPQGPEAPNYLGEADRWKNYSDMVVYELEVLLRKFLQQKDEEGEWAKDRRGYWKRYTCGMMFEQLYARKAEKGNKEDQTKIRRLAKLLAYYSTRIQKNGSVRGKNVSKSIYNLSLRRYKMNPPYSLRLRIEWLAERGEIPTYKNMALPKDDLKRGHARNKKTDANMERRREQGRKAYYERYPDRKH